MESENNRRIKVASGQKENRCQVMIKCRVNCSFIDAIHNEDKSGPGNY